jgi:hypothetical protein
MTKEDVLRMAKEAGARFDPHWGIAYNVGTATFERFATLVAAAEREAILQMSADNWYKTQNDYDDEIRQRNNQ